MKQDKRRKRDHFSVDDERMSEKGEGKESRE